MISSDELANFYRMLNLRVPLEGIPDNLQPCQVMDCPVMPAEHTMFMEHPTTGLQVRFMLCAAHAEPMLHPKPIGQVLLVKNTHIDSIPKEQRERIKVQITRSLSIYANEQNVEFDGEVDFTNRYVKITAESGQPLEGTEFMGVVKVKHKAGVIGQ